MKNNFLFKILNIDNSPVKIVVNDNELEDKIILYKKIEIEDNNNYELDKDNLILNAFIKIYYFNYLVFRLLYQW